MREASLLYYLFRLTDSAGMHFRDSLCHFSQISGIVCHTNNQDFSFKLDFTSSDSLLFIGDACPYVVTGCPTSAEGLYIGENELGKAISFNLIDAVDEMSLSKYTHLTRRAVLRFRDVHGIIGYGPRSAIMINRIVSVSMTDGIKIKDASVRSRSAPGSMELEDNSEGWIVGGELFVGSAAPVNRLIASGHSPFSTSRFVSVDPGSPYIVIPKRFEESLRIHMHSTGAEIRDGKVWIQRCETAAVPQLGVVFSNGSFTGIKIKRSQLLSSTDTTGSGCFIRVVISHLATNIVLGMPFVRSIDKVVLDGVNKRIAVIERTRWSKVISPLISAAKKASFRSLRSLSLSLCRNCSFLGAQIFHGTPSSAFPGRGLMREKGAIVSCL